MSMRDDPLYGIFEEHLHSGLYDDQAESVFLSDVVEFYLHKIKLQGFVPYRMDEHLRNDLAADVKDMLKAKTYGHSNIGAYNRARDKKTG
jgi:hypothetical protein